MGERATRVVVVDDHRLFAAALGTALAAEGFCVTVPELTDLLLLERVVLSEAPDVILLDLDLGAFGSGESLLGAFVASGAAVLVVSGTNDDAMIGRCLHQGAAGWMSKCAPLDELLESVRAIAAGAPGPRPPCASLPAAPATSFDWLTRGNRRYSPCSWTASRSRASPPPAMSQRPPCAPRCAPCCRSSASTANWKP